MSNYGYALGMTDEDIESKARLLFGYIGFEPISDPRAVALLAAIPTASERSAVALRAMALGANGNGIQKAIGEAFDQVRPLDAGPTDTAPTLKLPFYKSKKFWAIASSVLVVGAAATGAVLWRRHHAE